MDTMLKLDLLEEWEFTAPRFRLGFRVNRDPHNILNKTAPRDCIAKTTKTRSYFPTFLPNQAFAGAKP